MKHLLFSAAALLMAAFMLCSCGGPKEGLYRCDYTPTGDGPTLEMYLNLTETHAQLAIHRSYKKSFRYSEFLKSTSLTTSGGETTITFLLPGDPTSAATEEMQDRTFVMTLKDNKIIRVDEGLIPDEEMEFVKIESTDTVQNGAFAPRTPSICTDPRCWMAYGPVNTITEDGLTYQYDPTHRISKHPVGKFMKHASTGWSRTAGYPKTKNGFFTVAWDCMNTEGSLDYAYCEYSYNGENQLVHSDEGRGMIIDCPRTTNNFFYNRKGQLTKLTSNSVTLVLRYDARGLLASITNIKKDGSQSVANYDIQQTDDYGNPTAVVYLGAKNNRVINRSYTYTE